MAYYSTKTYGHNIGLSAVFRQPNADHSHCHLLHGYSLQFKFTFGCAKLVTSIIGKPASESKSTILTLSSVDIHRGKD